MMKVHRWGVVCLISCLPLAPGLADEIKDRAQILLQKAVNSSRTLNYDGIVVYTHGHSIDTLKVVHRYGEAGEYERITSLTGRPSEITRNDGYIHYRFADKETYGVYQVEGNAQRLVGHLAEKYDQLAQLYEFHPFNGARVAGRNTQGFLIQPKDHFRYGFELLLDSESGMVLKSRLLGEDGPVETLIFTDIHYQGDMQLDDQLVKKANHHRYTPEMVVEQVQWAPNWLPKGFELTRALKRKSLSSGVVSHRMLLSDGISMVTVFIEPLGSEAGPDTAFARKGATTGFTTVAGQHRITAVGEVPPMTVQKIAQSLTIH